MKTRLSFLKAISIICLSLFLSFLNCGSNSIGEIETPPQEILKVEPILKFEFGADNLPDEYLLARPPFDCLDVDSEGCVYIR